MQSLNRALRLTLLSHGATASTRSASFPADDGLEEREFPRLARLPLRVGRVDRVLTSPASAARETASAFKEPSAVDPMVREWDHGRWAGLPLEEVARLEPEALSAWREDADARPHGGETLNELLARAGAWLDRESTGTGRILAVTHPSVLRAAVLYALGAPATSFWHIEAGPLTVVTLSFAAGRWTLRSIAPALRSDRT